MRGPLPRPLFWPLITLASALEAIALGCLTEAAFSKPIPRGYTEYAPSSSVEIFGREASLSWSTDRGLLIAAMVLAVAGVVVYAVAARAR
jgi:hypothetical protein